MAILDQINVIACAAGDLIGTGHLACDFDWKRIRTIEISRRGYAYTAEQTLAEIQMAQQKEDLFIISDMESFKLVPVEPTMSTSDGSGDESVDGELPYKYEMMFKNKGVNFWRALRRFNSNGVFNVAFYDVEGNKIFTQSKGGLIKGFGTNMIFTGQYKGQEGSAPAEFKMLMQLSDVYEMERQSWISNDTVDYGISDLSGYNDVVLTASPAIVGATSLVVKATLVDKTHFASGLVLADFLVKKAGVAVVVSAVVANEDAKTYTLTVPALTAGTYTVATKNTFGKAVVLQTVTGMLYKGIEATIIAASVVVGALGVFSSVFTSQFI